jgi:hypothetical protein
LCGLGDFEGFGEFQGVGRVAYGSLAVRDSTDPDGPKLRFTLAEWQAFISGAKDGEFDR